MKKLSLLIALVVLSACFGNEVASARTIQDLPGLPPAVLKHHLPANIYRRLAREPVKAHLVLRGQIIGNAVAGARVIRSEGNGVYDKAAVQIANGMRLWSSSIGTRLPPNVVVHILIYQLPKGEHAIALAQDDTVGDTNLIYSHSIRMEFLGLKGATDSAPKRKKN